MHLRALYLHNFRLYEEALFEFSPHINVIRGHNARGKTSLIEAIYYLMTGRSFRTARSTDLIRHGASFFYLDASFVKHGVEQKLRIHYNGKERKVFYNATACPSPQNVLGLLQGTVIHPDDAGVVKGAPTVRRHLLDLQIAQADPLYVHHLMRYDRAMQQRNSLLKARTAQTIDSWEYEMANAASYVVRQRAQAVSDLQESGRKFYERICGGAEELSLIYKPHGAGDEILSDAVLLRDLYCDQYKRHRRREMEIGATLTGPHKDDLVMTLGNKDVRGFASEGQQRSCVVALRLAEWDRLKSLAHEKPLMLIDDFGTSLDASRRQQLLQHVGSLGQVFITTTGEAPLLSGEHALSM